MRVYSIRYALAFIAALLGGSTFAADDTWGANANTAWYTTTNWASTSQFPGLQGAAASNTDIATFTSAATATTFGINMTTANLNLGAIVFDSTRITATSIGNSSTTVAGVLRLYGTTANSVANTVLWNAGTGVVTLQAAQASGGTMGVVLGNTTNVIQITGSGGITISSNITEINSISGLSLRGAGAGVLTLSGTNTYTGATTIAASNTIQFATVASLYNGTTSSWTAANINVSGTLALNVGGTNQFTAANVTTLLTNLGGVVSNNGLRSGSRIAFDTTGGNFTVADNIANSTGTGGGAIGLTKLGSNVLTLTGTNTYTGTTTINGTLRTTSIGSGPISFNSSSAVLASASSAPITIPGNVSHVFTNSTFNFGDAVGTGTITLAGGVSLSGSGNSRTVNTVVDVNVTGTLSGSNSLSLTKIGTATLTLSNVASTVGGANNVIVTAGVLAVTRLANSTTNSSIGQTNVAATVASITLDGGTLSYINGGAAASSTNRLLQIGQTTAGGTGTIRNNASSATETLTFSNTNVVLYGSIDQTRTLILGGTNAGLNTLATAVNNNGTGVVTVTKQDSGTWLLSGTNNYTGVTTLGSGRLVLDYSINNTSKLSDTVNGLTLGGAISGGVGGNPVILELKGGSHTEIVTSTTLTAGTSSSVIQNGGTSILRMNAITFNTGATIDFGASSIASTSTANNATGILSSGATVAGSDWATNSGTVEGGTSNFITAYAAYADIQRLSPGVITNTSTANVRIIEGSGSVGNITLSAATTAINTLNQSISGGTGAATVALAGQTLRTNGILMGPTAGTLTIGATGGTAAFSGTLTNTTGAGGTLIFTNNSLNDMVVNSVLADNSTTNSYFKSGTGSLVLAGDNTFNSALNIQDGIVKAGKNSTSNSAGPFGGANSSASIILANKATAGLDINGFNVSVKDLQGGGALGGNVTLSSGNTLTLANPASGSAIYNGIIGGAGNLTLTGSSGQTFNTAHTYTGVTSWIGGVGLTVNSIANGNSPSGIGQSSNLASNLILGGGGNLAFNSTTVASTDRLFTLSGNFTLNVNGAGSLTFANTGAVAHSGVAAKTLTLGGTGAGSGIMALGISDSGTGSNITSITKGSTSTNTWTLNNTSNTFTGAITFNSTTVANGTLAYASAGGTNLITFAQTTGSATLSYTGPGQIMSGLIQANALSTGTITLNASGSGAINYSNPGSLGVGGASGAKVLALTGTNTGNNTLAGTWADNTLGGAARITKSGTGTWVLSAANTYSGGTTVNSAGGVLRITDPAALGSGTIANSNAGSTAGTLELQLTGTNTIANNWTTVSGNLLSTTGVAHIRNVSGNNTLSGSITLNSSGGNGTNIESNGGLLTLTGTISSTVADSSRANSFGGTGDGLITGSGTIADTGGNKLGVVKSGTGTWTFNSANTYTGNTNVTAGTLVVSGSLATGSAVAVNGGTLAGTGTVNGTLAVSPGGTLRGGDSAPANLSANLNLAGNSTITGSVTPGAGGTVATYLDVPSGVILGNSKFLTGATTMTFDDLGGTGSFNFRLLNDNGLTNGTPYEIIIATTSGGSFAGTTGNFAILSDSGTHNFTNTSLTVVGNDLRLSFTPTAVPEPGTLLGLSAAGLGFAGWIRRRRSAP